MTMILDGRTTDYDGSPDGDNEIQTATNGPQVITFSGSGSVTDQNNTTPRLRIFARGDTAEYTAVEGIKQSFGTFRINFGAGQEWYAQVDVPPGKSVDLSAIDG